MAKCTLHFLQSLHHRPDTIVCFGQQDIKYKMADSTHGCDNPANKDVKVPKCYDCTDEKCLVWSRVAALQTFVKLYGKVDKALFKDKKELEVTIRNGECCLVHLCRAPSC